MSAMNTQLHAYIGTCDSNCWVALAHHWVSQSTLLRNKISVLSGSLLTITLVLGYLLWLLMKVKCDLDFQFLHLVEMYDQQQVNWNHWIWALSIHSPHRSHLFSHECHCHEPGCSVHDRLNIPLHVYINVQAKLKQVWRLHLVLTDCLINLGEYKPVLPTTEEHTTAELTENNE